MANKGVIYYKLESIYDGDITKYCGLSGGEIDGNFFFLRGNDIETGEWQDEGRKLILTKVNGDKIIVEGIDSQVSVEGTYYDPQKGILVLNINGVEYEIDGFSVDKEYKVYSGSNIKGIGTMNDPLNVSETLKTGFFTPAERFLDLTKKGNFLPNNVKLGDRYLTKEDVSSYGLLYNFAAVQAAQCLLSEEASKWRIPSKDDWAEMLNALELCEEDMNHDGYLSNKYYGKIAGAYLKNDSFVWVKVETKEESQENNGSILPIKNTLPFPTFAEYNETVIVGNKYEISGVTENGVLFFDQYICDSPWAKCECDGCECVTPISALTKSYGFMALPAGVSGFGDNGETRNFGRMCGFWSIDQDNETDAWVRVLQYNKDSVRQQGEATDGFYSLRLVRDYVDGISDVELIDGLPYNTVLMPYVKLDESGKVVERGNRVWTQQNVSFQTLLYGFMGEKAKAIYPKDENGNILENAPKYFLNYWNGKSWEKREFTNNSMIVLSLGLNGERDEEWQLINGELYKRSEEIISELTKYVDTEIESIINKHDRDITSINNEISSLDKKISVETEERKAEDEAIREDLNAEIEARKEAVNTLSKQIVDLKEKDIEIENKLNSEIERSTEADEQFLKDIEVLRAEDVALSNRIDDETDERKAENEAIKEEITALSSDLKTEIKTREANDIIFPSDGEVIFSMADGIILSTNGSEELNIPIKSMNIKIDADFGEL